ncbi:MAG: LbtU family siderophore porin, partial [Gammaproteobacteria bacterium]|nr:LbtU family siderophore porin [Gammaproteobacteria bacterium]
VAALLVALTVLSGSTAVFAAGLPMEQRIQILEQNLEKMQKKMEQQEKVIVEQQDAIVRQRSRLQQQNRAASQAPRAVSKTEWWQGVEMNGVIEVEAGATDPYVGDHEGDLVVATVEIGMTAQINEWVAGEITLLYEEDATDLEVDVATITIANTDKSPFSFVAGQSYIPFGMYETSAVSDPLTLDLGETRETAAQVRFEANGWAGSVFVFNGAVGSDAEDKVGQYGVSLGYTTGFGTEGSAEFGISYINSLGDSDALQDVLITTEPGSYTGGMSAFVTASYGPWTVIGEYLTTTDGFSVETLAYNGAGAKPSAWNLELNYATYLFGAPTSFALVVQATSQALGLELPKSRILLVASTKVNANTTLSLEVAQDEDYGSGDTATNVDGVISGSGKGADGTSPDFAHMVYYNS